jgi:hypothetical protein
VTAGMLSCSSIPKIKPNAPPGLCYCLMRRKTEYRATRDAINSIVLWTMETGLVTTYVHFR